MLLLLLLTGGLFWNVSLFPFFFFHCMSSAVAPVLQKNSKVSKWIHRLYQGILSGLCFFWHCIFFLLLFVCFWWGGGYWSEAASRDRSPSLTSAQHEGESSVSALLTSPSAAVFCYLFCYHLKNCRSVIGSRFLQHGCQKAAG